MSLKLSVLLLLCLQDMCCRHSNINVFILEVLSRGTNLYENLFVWRK